MSATLIISIFIAYFIVLMLISKLTKGESSNDTFFSGNRSSKWYLVSFGMIGASLSGVTFLGVTGQVGNAGFVYMQMVFGYLIGYIIIAYILLPLYYRNNLVSIYQYLNQRLGKGAYKTGAITFLLSRGFQASVRVLMVVYPLQKFVFEPYGVPPEFAISLAIILIWAYTLGGGIKTVVITDTFQTIMMLGGGIVAFYAISQILDLGFFELGSKAMSDYSGTILPEASITEKSHWLKGILSGILITVCMTGLDQDMMQKNLTCKNLKEAQKNMLSFSGVLILVNLGFLILGAALVYLVHDQGINDAINKDGKYITDMVFTEAALGNYLGLAGGIMFILGLVAATFSSADSALTSLTTVFSVDILEGKVEKRKRNFIHAGFAIILIIIAIIFYHTLEKDALGNIFTIASYVYGPLLGMFLFGILTKYQVKDAGVPIVCILAPILTFIIVQLSSKLGYQFNYELSLLNALLTFAGLYLIKKHGDSEYKTD